MDWTDPGAVLARLQQNAGVAALGLVGTPGYGVPVLRDPLVIDPGLPGAAEALRRAAIKIEGEPGPGNLIVLDRDTVTRGLVVELKGKQGNLLLLGGPQQLIKGRLRLSGHHNAVVLGASGKTSLTLTMTLRAQHSLLFVGDGVTCGGAHIWLEGEATSVALGEDGMLATEIWLRTADGHGIIDLETGRQTNPPRSILLEPHVWLGQEVLVMPGVRIGAGSIVGARAVVTKPVPRHCVAAGIPARVIRRGASWTRSALPGPDQVGAVVATLREEVEA
ncbi:acyltransferase [Pseudoroseomonas cervicalis]|uniref:acyltransferase n=1 Tax=Teichococcus cervicalis TaxID=204525 RepID=UPI0022F15FBA|nr:acyltransferase [Pseudoroseomonas cervicalis]WBV45197.1 acyltransferase [Pseudoroseomonas cervicalis]